MLYCLNCVSSYFKILIYSFLEGDMKIKYPMDIYLVICEETLMHYLFSLGIESLSRVLAAQRWECFPWNWRGWLLLISESVDPIQSLISANAILIATRAQDWIWWRFLWPKLSPVPMKTYLVLGYDVSSGSLTNPNEIS